MMSTLQIHSELAVRVIIKELREEVHWTCQPFFTHIDSEQVNAQRQKKNGKSKKKTKKHTNSREKDQSA